VITPVPSDLSGNVIPDSISEISSITNYSCVSGVWTPVFTSEDTKKVLLQSRSDHPWMISLASGGTYFTIKEGACLSINLVSPSGNLMYWVVSDYNITLEVMEGR
jgi:hypothetical protein